MSLHSFSNQRDCAPVAALRRWFRVQPAENAAPERCELCGLTLASEHRHVLNLKEHVVVCACDECAFLFGRPGSGSGKYRAIPRRFLALQDFELAPARWEELAIPVNMVYIVYSSVEGRAIAFYPGPAGAMESLLDFSYWETMVEQNPILRDLEEDVEALFIHRGEDLAEYFLIPIDECYRLIGLIRSLWRGLGGGADVWQAMEQFFQRVRLKSGVMARESEGPWSSKSVMGGEPHA